MTVETCFENVIYFLKFVTYLLPSRPLRYHYRLPVVCLGFQEKPTGILNFGRRPRIDLKDDPTWRNDGIIERRNDGSS